MWSHQACQANRELFALLYFKNRKPLAAIFQPGNVRLIFKDPGTNYASFIDPLGSMACLFTNVSSIFFSVKLSWIGQSLLFLLCADILCFHDLIIVILRFYKFYNMYNILLFFCNIFNIKYKLTFKVFKHFLIIKDY